MPSSGGRHYFYYYSAAPSTNRPGPGAAHGHKHRPQHRYGSCPDSRRQGYLLRGYVGLLHKRHYIQALQEGHNHQDSRSGKLPRPQQPPYTAKLNPKNYLQSGRTNKAVVTTEA